MILQSGGQGVLNGADETGKLLIRFSCSPPMDWELSTTKRKSTPVRPILSPQYWGQRWDPHQSLHRNHHPSRFHHTGIHRGVIVLTIQVAAPPSDRCLRAASMQSGASAGSWPSAQVLGFTEDRTSPGPRSGLKSLASRCSASPVPPLGEGIQLLTPLFQAKADGPSDSPVFGQGLATFREDSRLLGLQRE